MNMNRRCGNAWSRLGTHARPLFMALLVSILAPALAEATAITLAWDPNSDSVTTGYYVYYGIQSGNYSGYVDVGGATTAIINTKDSTTTYYFAVQAYSSSGERSPYSTEVVWTPSTPPAQPPTLNNPGSLSTVVGSSAVSLQLVASDPAGLALTYAASGLPPGLSIASSSGVISGTPTTVGAYTVTAKVTNTAGLSSSSQSFTWSILNQPTSPTQPGNGKGGNGNGGGGNGDGSNKGGNGNGNGGGGNGNGGGGSTGTSPIDSGVNPVAPVDSGTVVEDVTAPTVSVLSPTSGSTYTTTNAKIVLTGTTFDDVGVVSVTWSNSRGGEGVAVVETPSWTTSAIDLKMGTNVLTVTATDAAGNVQTVTLTVTRNVDLQNQLN